MDFNEQEVQSYLKQKFQGRDSFLENIIFPIFGKERFENGFDDPVLESEADLKDAARKIGIESIIRYGELAIDLGSIHIFDITVSDKVLLTRNRVAVQSIVRRIIGTYTGAFMIFHYKAEDSWDWRFSFCCKDDKNMTEAKRYTFLLGPSEACRTAAQNFVQLANTVRMVKTPAMIDIVKAFDVETLSREFFAKYKSYYEDFVKYVTGKSFKKIDGKWKEVDDGTPHEAMYKAFGYDDRRVRDYVKKLLGRIVFLHFLQKKGWLGADAEWKNGDPEFMLHLYQRSDDNQKDNFLDAVLEPLFSDALDTDRSEMDDLYDTGVIGVGKVKIPYLNGGLFTRDEADEIESVFPRDYFGKFLAFLAEYNFTIDENDSTEAEVGVDPEMLSCIFENLLEDNKDKGAYYTPKAIVEYMCRESLTTYLQSNAKEADKEKIATFVKSHDSKRIPRELAMFIDSKLRNVKICDPAIGSGAFPMGLLRELQLCRMALEDETKSPAEIKKEILQNNIYGVDIEKGAVDIARLRFWLSLVVDEPTPAALPNLDFKIMQGNSLLESFGGVRLDHVLEGGSAVEYKTGKKAGRKRPAYWQQTFAYDAKMAIDEIVRDKVALFNETDHIKKQILIERINKNVKAFIASKLDPESPFQSIIPDGQNDQFFLWHIWFSDVFANGGFDIVIGNPPYVKLEKIKDQSRLLSKEGYEVYEPRSDLYCLFTERGFNLLKKGGVISYIMSNKFLQADYGESLRKFFLKRKMTRLIDFGDNKIFQGATVYPFIFVAERNDPVQVVSAVTMKRYDSQMFAKDIPAWSMDLPVEKLTSAAWILSLGEADLLARIKSECTTLKAFIHGEAFYGIKPGVTAAFIVNDDTKHDIVEADPKAADVMRPMVRGRDIKPYFAPHTGMWFVGTHNGYDGAPAIDVMDYPSIKSWLDRYADKLKARVGQGRTLYNLITIGYWARFAEPKIMYQQMQVKPCFVYDESGLFCNNSMWIIPTREKGLVGLLNSKMGWWLISKFCTQIQNGYQLLWEYFGKIPVPKNLPSELSDKVDAIIAAKKADANADTSALEAEIDDIVFDIYGLTAEERELVIAKNK